MGDYLRSWGYSLQRPKKKAYEQCSKKVQLWLDHEYPAIKERAKRKKLKSIGVMKQELEIIVIMDVLMLLKEEHQ